jgi:glycosyltransferase involved in cell wall biosynthesis
MRIAVIVATKGRAQEVGQLLLALERQTLPPSAIVLSVTQASDAPEPLPPAVTLLTGTPGCSIQRNRGLDFIQGQCDIVVFFDDDFLPACDTLSAIAAFFDANPDVAGVTGNVLADGIMGPGLPYDEALAILADYEAKPRPAWTRESRTFVYGCNMAFRSQAIGGKRFDENLPFYAWQEDTDFGGQVSAEGKVIRTNAFAGVHRGVKKSRSTGRDLGFSQVVNPIYLLLKGTMTADHALFQILRNVIANHVKSFRPEPYIDRWGRVRGNWDGIIHVLTGRIHPGDIPSKRLGDLRRT